MSLEPPVPPLQDRHITKCILPKNLILGSVAQEQIRGSKAHMDKCPTDRQSMGSFRKPPSLVCPSKSLKISSA